MCVCFHLIHLHDAGRISSLHQSLVSDSTTPCDPTFTWVSLDCGSAWSLLPSCGGGGKRPWDNGSLTGQTIRKWKLISCSLSPHVLWGHIKNLWATEKISAAQLTDTKEPINETAAFFHSCGPVKAHFIIFYELTGGLAHCTLFCLANRGSALEVERIIIDSLQVLSAYRVFCEVYGTQVKPR